MKIIFFFFMLFVYSLCIAAGQADKAANRDSKAIVGRARPPAALSPYVARTYDDPLFLDFPLRYLTQHPIMNT